MTKRTVVAVLASFACTPAWPQSPAVALGGTGEGYAYVACLYAQTKARVIVLASPEAPQNSR